MNPIKDLPALPRDMPGAKELERMREAVQRLGGYRGDPLDRALTLRDLISAGIIDYRPGRVGIGGGGGGGIAPGSAVTGYEPDLTPPPTPTGLAVTAGITYLYVQCDAQTYLQGHGHDRTNVYGAQWPTGDPEPVFADAIKIADFAGTVCSIATNPSTRWCIWIKWKSIDGVESTDPEGGLHGAQATTGQDVSQLLEALSGAITQTELFSTLSDRIDLIDAADTVAGSVAARIKTETDTRISEDAALASAITLLAAGSGEQFDYQTIWYFDTGVDSFTGNGTPTASGGFLRPANDASDPYVVSPTGVGANGTQYGQVKMRIRKYGSPTWDGYIWWRAAADATWDAGRRAALAEPTYDANGIGMVSEFPGWAVTVDRIRIDLSAAADATDYFTIDWIAIGRPSPGASAAALLTEQTVRAAADSAMASSITTLSTSVATDIGTVSAALSTEASTRASETGDLFAQYTVKVDLNGFVAGYGLASTAVDGTPTAEFAVRADKFYVAPPTDYTQESAPTVGMVTGELWWKPSTKTMKRYDGAAWVAYTVPIPFTVVTTTTTFNGQTVPPGTYMDAAYIKAGTITGAKIGTATIDDAHINTLAATKLTAGSIGVGEYIQSTGYIAGSTGWRITGNGNAEFSGVVVRGTIYASAGTIGGSIIASTYMQSNTYSSGTSGWKLNSDGTGQIGGFQVTTGGIQSSNYVLGTTGWRLAYDGTGQLKLSTLSAISADLGTITAGTITAVTIKNSTDSVNINMAATGSSLVLRAGASTNFGPYLGTHYPVEISADGTAFFSRGSVRGGVVKASGDESVSGLSVVSDGTAAMRYAGEWWIDTGFDDPVVWTNAVEGAEIYSARAYVITSYVTPAMAANAYMGNYLCEVEVVWSALHYYAPSTATGPAARIWLKVYITLADAFGSLYSPYTHSPTTVRWTLYQA